MRVLVVGAAVSGMAAARLGRRLGHSVSIYDRSPQRTADILAEGFGAVVGRWDITTLAGIDLVVASPGVPERAEPFTHALEMRIPVWSEIEFAWRHLECPTVAVTGTNGKTTVTGLIAAMMSHRRPSTVAAGNIGLALSDVVGTGPEAVVIEVSSFQLRFTERFHPQVAVVTNVADDHLDWHGSFERYLAAKTEITARQHSEDFLIVDGDDPGARRVASASAAQVVEVSGFTRRSGGGVEDGRLWVFDDSIDIAELAVGDPVFLVDVAMAGAAAVCAGTVIEDVWVAARGFRPGNHRRTVVASHRGVAYVNDSKATNPHAALASIGSFPSVVLIAGGITKGLDISPLARHPHVRHVVAIGESAGVLTGARPEASVVASSMAEAVAMAAEVARPGDTVLLAPGCASFDMFDSYSHRGDAFSEAVRAIMQQPENAS